MTTTVEHGWVECRPVMLGLEGADPEEGQRASRAIAVVWARLTDYEKLTFHEFCCMNIHDGEHFAVMRRISTALQDEME